jgi:hypothetical protein
MLWLADEFQPLTSKEECFWHASWRANRRRVWESFGRLHINSKRCEAFRCCGSSTWLERKADDVRIRANRCHDPNCQPCNQSLIANVRLGLAMKWKPGRIRFITLTLKHSSVPLRDQWKTMRRHFQELRRSKLWKAHVQGGAAFAEDKIGNDGLWHPHLHIVADGTYLDQAELRKLWHSITLQSWIVDIRAADDEAQVVYYVSKYVTKPFHQSVFNDPDKLDEAIMARHGMKKMTSFGTWKTIKLRKREKPADTAEWKPIGRVDALINQRDAESQRWAEVIKRKYPRLYNAFFDRASNAQEHPPPE